ncbi:MAG: RNA polymerase factor sigma-54 [Phycisphaerae bacterium]|nr:RNA polymerase factor sigma-54 [Phycisphaerae bacterium]NUQ45434.1 RNA polymerase factor sigma-54 [Phycisphaerae bacterium]
MSQHFSMIATQSMRLEQRLTPQLIQSMEILQLPLMALETRIREELEINPVLEDASLHDEPSGATAAEDQPAERPEADTSREQAESFERLERLSREYDFDPGDLPYGRVRNNGERDAKMDAMANSAARGPSLQEHLERQWSLMELSPEVKHAGLIVIGWMDPDGYLRTKAEHTLAEKNAGDSGSILPLLIRRDAAEAERLDDEIAKSVHPPIDPGVLEEAIARVQTLEPKGVGARDLTECLLIQLDALPESHELAETLVENHLHDIAKNRFPVIARATGRTVEEIKEAMAIISRLHHHPGSVFSPEEVPPIVPDVMVDYADDGDGYTVRLTRGNSPSLRISPQYRHMLTAREADATALAFLRKNLESAKSLIDAIHFRRDRMLEISRVIVERQREFLDFGPQFLKILRMRDLAEELGCDPSTISRTVDGKYMQTPRGIYPMRMFFTGGTETQDGDAISWDAIKMKVKEIIEREDKADPLSDDAIAKQLSEQGNVTISRRTVAKYRAQLMIPPARERKQF